MLQDEVQDDVEDEVEDVVDQACSVLVTCQGLEVVF